MSQLQRLWGEQLFGNPRSFGERTHFVMQQGAGNSDIGRPQLCLRIQEHTIELEPSENAEHLEEGSINALTSPNHSQTS